MQDWLNNINKAFESRLRLGIMSILVVNDWVEFARLKELLETTDGNLASHISALEKLNYIEARKQFLGKKPNTTYRVTQMGRDNFKSHLTALENMLKNNNK